MSYDIKNIIIKIVLIKINFDFVIDTTNLTINEAYLEVLNFIQENTKI